VTLAKETTLPKYMTNQPQYRLGVFVYILFACGFFLLLVKEHGDVLTLLSLLGLGIVPRSFVQAAQNPSAPYLIIIFVMGAVYLYLLTREGSWNVLLMMRDVIQRWISIPQLVRVLMTQIQGSLQAPDNVVATIAGRATAVAAGDFAKDRATPDRRWAETCYMEWWLSERLAAGQDGTFFDEDSINYDQLVRDFNELRPSETADPAQFKTSKRAEIEMLHKRFSRVVACYLIYRNGSRKDLCTQATQFGMKFKYEAPDNPLRFWIIYVIALVISVQVGVYVSAVGFDLLHGNIDLRQDPDLAWAWVVYTLCNFGLAIFVILAIRLALRLLQMDQHQSHLITYCWTFVVAVLVGPLGLTIAAHFSPYPDLQAMPLPALYLLLIKWGIAPGLVCVYISYYLDRQTYYDLPDIVHSLETVVWRLLNCVAFAAVAVLLLMPPILTVQAHQGVDQWTTEKLQFVSAGCTFFLVLGLALAAQFALRKRAEKPAARLSAAALTS
jgi:hypothetical protein